MKKTGIVIVALSLGLSACVSQKATLVNARGETARCNQWGFGLVGVPVALAQHEKCLKDAKAAGYSDTKEQ